MFKLASSLKRPCSPVCLLLFITLSFCFITFLIQSFLIELNPFRSNKPPRQPQQHLPRYFDFNYDTQNQNDNLKKCQRIINLDLHLKDLLKVKQSYLIELKRIEQRRSNLIQSVNDLKDQLNYLRSDLDNLIGKANLNKNIIFNQYVKLNEIETKLDDKSKILNQIEFQTNLINSNSINNIKPLMAKTYSIESCIKFNKCNSNQPIDLFIFNSNNSFVSSLIQSFDFKSLNFSISLVNRPDLSCFSVIFLYSPFDHVYYQEMTSFLSQNFNQTNFLFVVLNRSKIGTKLDLIEYLKSLNQTNMTLLEHIINCSIFSSFLESNQNNLHLNFGLIFDQSISNISIETKRFSQTRKFLLTYHESSNKSEKSQFVKSLFKNSTNIEIDLTCSQNDQFSNLCFNSTHRLNVLSNSMFTLLIPNDEPNDITIRLIESIKTATIPILIDADYKLPLDSLIAWNEIIIQIPFQKINNLISILDGFDFYDLSNRQIKARNVYKSYFSSSTQHFKTLIAALQTKLIMPSAPILNQITQELNASAIEGSFKEEEFDYDEGVELEYLGETNQKPMSSDEFKRNFTQSTYMRWNTIYYPFNLFPSNPFESSYFSDNKYAIDLSEKLSQNISNNALEYTFLNENNFTFGGGDGKYFNHYLSGNQKEEQFTIVILTYKREKILTDYLYKYLKMPYLNSIIIVWNSNDEEPTNEFKSRFRLYLATKRLRIVKSERNSLNNRFLPYDMIKTDAILSLDDDTILRPDEVIFAFRVWRENRDRIVGFPARYHTFDLKSNNYVYFSYLSCEYSMVLTGAAFYHKFYNYYYSYIMDKAIRDKVDDSMNCEDISFNMMVSHLTRKPPIKVTTKYSFYCAECEAMANNNQTDLPVSLQIGHYEKRTDCLRHFVNIYGYNPLLYSQFRADSVLYKTKLPPQRQKCFKLI